MAKKKSGSAAIKPRSKQTRVAGTYGYARVSTHDQTTAAQKQALRQAGCSRVVEEIASGGAKRAKLWALLEQMQEGDTLVVHRLDRLGRSLADLMRTAEWMRERGLNLRSLSEGWDTATATGRMLYAIFGTLAEYERELLRERTRAALAERARRGLPMGRPHAVSHDKALAARYLIEREGRSITAVAREMGVHRTTLSKALATLPPPEQGSLAYGDGER